MPDTTIDVLDAQGTPKALIMPPPSGRAAQADSRPVVLSTEDLAMLTEISGRLQSILSAVDGLEAATAASDAIATTTNGLLTGLQGYVDGLEGLSGATNTLLTTLNGYVDGLEALAAAAIPAGANVIGKVGIDQTTPGTTNAVHVKQAYSSAKVSVFRNSIASTNAELLTSGAKMVFNVLVANKGAAWIYVKLYNKASSPNDADIPVLVIPCAPGAVIAWNDILGTAFSLGIGIRITAGAANTDNTGVAAGDVQVTLQYSI